MLGIQTYLGEERHHSLPMSCVESFSLGLSKKINYQNMHMNINVNGKKLEFLDHFYLKTCFFFLFFPAMSRKNIVTVSFISRYLHIHISPSFYGFFQQLHHILSFNSRTNISLKRTNKVNKYNSWFFLGWKQGKRDEKSGVRILLPNISFVEKTQWFLKDSIKNFDKKLFSYYFFENDLKNKFSKVPSWMNWAKFTWKYPLKVFSKDSF